MDDDILETGGKILTEKGMGFTGAGSSSGNSQRLAREYFDSLLIETRVIDAVEATTAFRLFGESFQSPVMVAALSGLDRVAPGGMADVARGAVAAGCVMWAGIGSDEELRAIVSTGARTVKIIKPYRDMDVIFRKIAVAEECGVLAVGMDVSFGFGMKNGFMPAPMSPKSLADIKRFVGATRLPFVVKGVLSERDAAKALDAGAAGIVVSHQGGTVTDCAVPPAMLLPRIADVVRNKIPVIAECGIGGGMDVFKALALGADAVCIGRAVAAGLAAAGADGVRRVLEEFTAGLRRTMSLTGARDVGEIDSGVVYRRE